jgi:transaldolase
VTDTRTEPGPAGGVRAGAHGQPPLLVMTRTTPTRLWNDSADPLELSAALGWGAVGATANPVIALAALRADGPRWRSRIAELAAQHGGATESELGLLVVKELSVAAAALLEPAFRASGGRDGRLSIQTDPRLWRDPDRLLAQAEDFDGLAPNIIVKIPATSAGLVAIEEATARGVSINATVSFTVAQALAVGDAVERGLHRREAAGHDVSAMGPVCTIMVGRLDDWMKVSAERAGVTLDPGYFEWAGVAAFKRAYGLYRERGYRARLLSAAFRNHMHWSQLVGGEVVISPPFGWQQRLNASGIDPVPRIDEPVAPAVVDSLYRLVSEFRRAYDPDGLAVGDFDTFGATRRTLRQFLTAAADLDALVRDVLLPDPDQS